MLGSSSFVVVRGALVGFVVENGAFSYGYEISQ